MFPYILATLVLSTCEAIFLPRPKGPISVSYSNHELVDKSRKDPWKLDTIPYRRIMLSGVTPIPGDCPKTKTVPYMSPTIVGAEDNILLPYGWPAGILRNIYMEFCVQPGHHKRGGQFPESWFQRPYVRPPFETDIVEFLYRTIAYGEHTNIFDVSSMLFALDIRSQDVSFVLNGFEFKERETEKMVKFGHSFGGASTAAAMGNDSRIAGGVNLDGLLWGPVIKTGFKSPGNKKIAGPVGRGEGGGGGGDHLSDFS